MVGVDLCFDQRTPVAVCITLPQQQMRHTAYRPTRQQVALGAQKALIWSKTGQPHIFFCGSRYLLGGKCGSALIFGIQHRQGKVGGSGAVQPETTGKAHTALRLQEQQCHFAGRVVPLLAVIIGDLLNRLVVANHRHLLPLLLLYHQQIILLTDSKNAKGILGYHANSIPPTAVIFLQRFSDLRCGNAHAAPVLVGLRRFTGTRCNTLGVILGQSLYKALGNRTGLLGSLGGQSRLRCCNPHLGKPPTICGPYRLSLQGQHFTGVQVFHRHGKGQRFSGFFGYGYAFSIIIPIVAAEYRTAALIQLSVPFHKAGAPQCILTLQQLIGFVCGVGLPQQGFQRSKAAVVTFGTHRQIFVLGQLTVLRQSVAVPQIAHNIITGQQLLHRLQRISGFFLLRGGRCGRIARARGKHQNHCNQQGKKRKTLFLHGQLLSRGDLGWKAAWRTRLSGRPERRAQPVSAKPKHAGFACVSRLRRLGLRLASPAPHAAFPHQ